MSDLAPVAVVVVTWNARGYVAACLESLRGLQRAPMEVLVVDNASTDGTVALVRDRFPEVRRIEAGANLGFCRANNLGIRSTRAPSVLVLNPDTRLEPDFLEQLLPAFEDPAVGIACGKMFRFDGETLDSCGQLLGRSRQPVDRGYGRADRGRFEQEEPVFGACGAAALYRRAMLDAIADPGDVYFDEAFFAFYEDLDLAWRAQRLGWKARYRPNAVGYHARGGTARGGRIRRRLAAMLSRSPEIRFHIAKNRYLTILRNDTPGAYLRDAPFIWSRDIATLLLLLCSSPSVLARIWKQRHVFHEAMAKRKLDAGRLRHQLEPGTIGETKNEVMSDVANSSRDPDGPSIR
jgi:GT2 family glycosyltransferase